jgi:hypothetical protein
LQNTIRSRDDGGTVLVVGWLFVPRWILPADPSEGLEIVTA